MENTMTFKVGDKAVYPNHGVAEIIAIEDIEIAGCKDQVYVLSFPNNNLTVKVPVNNVRAEGVREVISTEKVNKVFKILRQKGLSVDTTTWNRRYREYMEKIKTGSVFEVAEVLRDLYLLKADKDLSFCELKLLDNARGLLIRELAIAKGVEEDDIEDELKVIFKHVRKHPDESEGAL